VKVREVRGEAKFGGIELPVPQGRTVHPCLAWVCAEIARLEDGIYALACLLLPAGAQQEAQQDAPMQIGEHRDIHRTLSAIVAHVRQRAARSIASYCDVRNNLPHAL
jgi:hypothetical protein